MLKLVMSALQAEESEDDQKSPLALETPHMFESNRSESPISSFRKQDVNTDESSSGGSEASKNNLQLPKFEQESAGEPPQSTLPHSRIQYQHVLSWEDQLEIEIENAQRAVQESSLLNTLSLNSTDNGSFETCNPKERWLMQMQRLNTARSISDSQSYEDNPHWDIRSPDSQGRVDERATADDDLAMSRSNSIPIEFVQSPRKWYRKADEQHSGTRPQPVATNNNPSDEEEEDELIKASEVPPDPSISLSSFVDKGAPEELVGEEKKDEADDENDSTDDDIRDCLSATESEVDPIDGLPSGLKERYMDGREQMLKSLDGIHSGIKPRVFGVSSPLSPTERGITTNPRPLVSRNPPKPVETKEEEYGPYFEPCFRLFWGKPEKKETSNFASWKEQHDVPLALLDCANLIHQEDRVPPPVPTSLVRVSDNHPQTFAETILPTVVDPRMQDWIAGQFGHRGKPPRDGSYHLGKSRTVIVHEINRGNWTWCTAWSPSGNLLAIATENHHLAIVETSESTVWRVRHDRRVRGPMKKDSTHSIRAMSWGSNYIAIGGTGNAVSILESKDPYQILHTIPSTGFVGSLDWKDETDVLAIGSRLDFAMIVQIQTVDDDSPSQSAKQLESVVLRRLEFKYWVNCVSFSPDGSCLAVGDSGGTISVYDYEEESNGDMEMNMITWFKRKDPMLSIEWSPDGKWLYAGGEDRSVTVIDTSYWEIVHRIGRDRWVQCISSSRGGSHLAVGGVSSEISILDVENGWDSVMGIELKGLVPLSAKWHPKDQYLAITGQDTSILAIETTNARHVKGHHLHSISPVLSIEFSPDGRMAIIGNQAGVVTFFSLSGTTFITAYELVIPLNNRICTQWSLNGMFVVIGSMNNLMVVGRKRNKRQGKKCPPNASGFFVKKVIRDFGETNAVSIDFQSHYVAVSGDCTRILDVRADFEVIREWANGPYFANAWSSDGRWLAMMGKDKLLTIYDTSSRRVDRWRAMFAMQCDFIGLALAWGPLIVGGLLYLAYGGDSNEIYIMEIRTQEGTWETVLRIPRDDKINALDWSNEGLLAAGIGNGTVGIMDLAYLQSGVAVNEMDYNWQRQALTCFTEIRRNRGHNSIQSLRWLPAAPGSDRLLAVGGTDGEVEIIDCTEKRRCRGYAKT